MTASLPVPQDAHSSQPDGDRSSARGTTSPLRPLPPKPETPADLAAQDAPPAPAVTRPPARAPRKKAAPRKKPAGKPAAKPGPPPPLPPDLVIPPKPPLPPVSEADLETEREVEAGTDTRAVDGADTASAVEGETAPAVDTEPEAVTEVEPEAVTEAEPEAATEAEPEAVTGPDPEAATEAEPALETGTEAAAVTEADDHVAPPDDKEAAVVDAEADTRHPEVEDAHSVDPDAVTSTEPSSNDEVDVLFDRDDTSSTPELLVIADPLVAASSESVTSALVVKGVTKAFGDTRAVDGIDLTVPAGIFYGLVGPNGAGKTTTLSMIAGLLRPDRGTIVVNGVDSVADPLGAKRQMGVLPDRLRTFDRLTGRQLLHYYGVLRGLPAAVVESRTTDLARAFDLSGALGRVVSDYSAGMLKKVMLAGALIHSPRLLVLDEPFESVDPVSSAIILDILSTYVAHGGTVILSSHGMDLVERVCSRVAVIVAGQVLAEGTVDEVRGELTLEQRFIELAGGLSDVEGLEWLHTFSD